MSVGNTETAAAQNNNDRQVVFKNCAPFTRCISKINNTQVDNAKDIDVVMPMYNLTQYSDNYSKTSGSLRRYYSNESAINDGGIVINFPGNSASFKFKQRITGKTENNGTKTAEIMVPLKYLSNFWRTLEMP